MASINIRNHKKILFLCSLLLLVNILKCDDVETGQMVFQLFHSLDPGPDPKYELRGFITINSAKNGEAFYVQDEVLSFDDIAKLKTWAALDGVYRVKLVENSPSSEDSAVFSFTKACAIYQSGLTDEITISLDQSNRPTGVAISASPAHCTGDPVPDSKLHTFNTSVNIVSLINAPVPDTLTYIQRLEQEKAEKARGEQGDNRSFLARYWMYIVPLVLFLFISGASGPEGQGGGR